MNNECECPQVEVKIKKSGSFASRLRGLLFGGLVGAGVALLAAPYSGSKTRDLLREKSNELRNRAMSQAEETRSRAKNVTEQGKSVFSEQKIQLQSTVEGVKEGLKTYQQQGGMDMSTANALPATGISKPSDLDGKQSDLDEGSDLNSTTYLGDTSDFPSDLNRTTDLDDTSSAGYPTEQ